MTYSKFLSIVCATALCASVAAVDASAQSRGRSGSRGPSVGRAAPRGPYGGGSFRGAGRYYAPRYYAPRYYGSPFFFPRYGPYASYYYPYRPGFSIGLYTGFGYGYPYYAGYPYGYAGYPYSYGYPSYGYPSYGYPYSGYGYGTYEYPGGYVGAQSGIGYGEVRIEGAPKDAQVYADGRMVGSVGDFDGPVRHLPLEAGAHEIEIRVTGMPPLTYDVNVRPGQTLTIHANVR
jgi:hypothetical protein